ncbi:MAG: helix-turn-helix transcriptional regulator [Nevskiaceae bacterium]|nr:MAG: helix-turn-helix transcriptional regulator [Nevskiaceae bacterium]TBR71440.1 MAG: helix-turn-helix transcriptional regulator [Nevskiaceae bacterium]
MTSLQAPEAAANAPASSGAHGEGYTEAFDTLVGAVYEGPMESPPWKTVLELLRAALDATHTTLILRPPSSDNTGVMINSGDVTTQGIESYESHYFDLDPFVKLKEGEVVSAEELLGEQWLKSEIYRDYMQAINVRHLLGADIYTKEGIECRLRATRPHGAAPFSERDKALCRALLPHLKRSIRLHAHMDRLECDRRLFAGTVNRLLVGMVSLSRTGTLLDINDEAQRILDEKDGIRLHGNALAFENNQESRDFQAMVRRALDDAPTDDSTAVEGLSITRPSGRAPLGVLVRAIPFGEWSESGHRPAAVIFLRDPESNSDEPSRDLLRRLYGLTRMESALAMLLVEGLTLDEAAEQLDVRRNTARTHLRSIFCKTGVTRQTMLVRLLLKSVVSLR